MNMPEKFGTANVATGGAPAAEDKIDLAADPHSRVGLRLLGNNEVRRHIRMIRMVDFADFQAELRQPQAVQPTNWSSRVHSPFPVRC